MRPKAIGILMAPFIQIDGIFLGEAQVGLCNSLEDIVIVLCDAKNMWLRLGHIPDTVRSGVSM